MEFHFLYHIIIELHGESARYILLNLQAADSPLLKILLRMIKKSDTIRKTASTWIAQRRFKLNRIVGRSYAC